jgi:ABC-2 type transport system ATP-binding protein
MKYFQFRGGSYEAPPDAFSSTGLPHARIAVYSLAIGCARMDVDGVGVALEAAGVSKRYGSRDALSSVDLVARPGELHGLLGPNGAGKTTLMRVILGLVARDGGSVKVFGRPVHSLAGGVPDGVAGSIETPAFYPYLSGRRNLELLGILDGLPPAECRRRVDDALRRTGMTAQAAVTAGAYSAGMRQRLGVASALLRSPRLLFLDEPTNALDPAGANDVRALVRDLAKEGVAVVFSSHDMAEIEALCTVLTVLDRGRVVFSGAVEDLRMLAPAALYTLRTSDDRLALSLASSVEGVTVAARGGGDASLDLAAGLPALDAYVIALGRAGVAVRMLEPRARSLESMFFALTAREDRPPASAPRTAGTQAAS